MHKYILFVLAIFVFTSCEDTEYSEINYDSEVFELGYDELIEFRILTKSTINKYVVEVPGNIFFKAYCAGEIVFENNKGEIISEVKDNTEFIEVRPYSDLKRYKFTASEDNVLKLIFNKKSLVYKDQIRLFSATNPKEQKKVMSESRIFKDSKLPIISIHTENQIITDTTKIFTDYKIFDNKENNLSDTPKKTGKFKIKIRGSSSKEFPKQSYYIKTYNDKLEKENTKLLNLPEENEWVLYAPYIDLSLMRNVISYDLSRKMGHYSPRTRYCHLVINNNYRGIYVLTEKIKVDKNRVNIEKSKKNNFSGAYIIKLDKGKGEVWRSSYNAQVDTGFGKWFFYVYPKPSNLSGSQKNDIKQYISDFEKAIVENKNWKDYIDIESFIDYQILMEIAKNVDAYRLSMYFSKDVEGKLKIEPIWDMNLTFGLTSYYEGYIIEGLMYEDKATPFWWTSFLKDDEYRKLFVKRWKEYRGSFLSISEFHRLIDRNYKKLNSEVSYNTYKWNAFQEKSNWRKYDQKSYKESIDYLKSWSKKRLLYLDKVFLELE